VRALHGTCRRARLCGRIREAQRTRRRRLSIFARPQDAWLARRGRSADPCLLGSRASQGRPPTCRRFSLTTGVLTLGARTAVVQVSDRRSLLCAFRVPQSFDPPRLTLCRLQALSLSLSFELLAPAVLLASRVTCALALPLSHKAFSPWTPNGGSSSLAPTTRSCVSTRYRSRDPGDLESRCTADEPCYHR
jgi:hypothetical protein